MFLSVLFSIIGIIFIIIMAATWGTASKPNNNIIFGVTIPTEELEGDTVKNLKIKYNNLCRMCLIAAIVSYLPVVFLYKQVTFLIIYFMIWIFLIMLYLLSKPIRVIHRQLKDIKIKNNWLMGAVHEVTVDTEASRLKNTKIIPVYWFIGALIISAIPVIDSLSRNKDMLFVSVVEFLSNAILILCYYASRKIKAAVISRDSSINVKVNLQRQRMWSLFWICAAYISDAAFLIVYLMIKLMPLNTIGLLSVTCISIIMIVGLIIYISNKISRYKSAATACGNGHVFADDDEYWKESWFAGLVYCNPDDSSTFVEKRIGVGQTVNLASPGGKAFCYGGIIFAVAILIFVSLLTVPIDNAKPSMQISNSVVSISCPLYGMEFKTDDIVSVSLIDKISVGLKTNGAATDEYCRGNFRVDNYGRSKLYIYNNTPPYIVIKLNDSYVFFNYKDKDETIKLYNRLNQMKPAK